MRRAKLEGRPIGRTSSMNIDQVVCRIDSQVAASKRGDEEIQHLGTVCRVVNEAQQKTANIIHC